MRRIYFMIALLGMATTAAPSFANPHSPSGGHHPVRHDQPAHHTPAPAHQHPVQHPTSAPAHHHQVQQPTSGAAQHQHQARQTTTGQALPSKVSGSYSPSPGSQISATFQSGASGSISVSGRTPQATFNGNASGHNGNANYNSGQSQFSGSYQTGANASVSVSGRTPTTSLNGNANGHNGNVNYNSGQSQFNGSYQTGPNGYAKASGISDGTSYSGQLSKNNSNFNYSSPDGPSVGGGYNYQNSSNYNVSGHYFSQSGQGASGSIGKTNGKITTSGEYRMPISVDGVPVAQGRFGGSNTFAGSNSTMDTHGNLYTPDGSTKVFGANDHIDKHNYNNQQQLSVGPATATTSTGVHFSGVNSTVTANQKVSAPGVTAQSSATVNNKGASTNVGLKVGGESVSAGVSVSGSGVKVSGSAPQLPSLPKVSVPNVSVPKISAPSFSAPSLPSF